MATLTSVEDVRNRWVLDTPFPLSDEQVRVQVEDAEDMIRRVFPDLDDREASGELPRARVVRVVSRMVLRVLKNRSGVRTIQETTGPFAGSTTFGGDHPGELYLTDEDLADLSPRRNGIVIGTARTVPGVMLWKG